MNPYSFKSLIMIYSLNIVFIIYVLLSSNIKLSNSIIALLTMTLIFPAIVIALYYKNVMRE
ncbi:MAG: hypothetical protein J7J78_02215 [Thermoprotei archaeon]|nr:hypothetical protein [Thermoprotei archaeon]